MKRLCNGLISQSLGDRIVSFFASKSRRMTLVVGHIKYGADDAVQEIALCHSFRPSKCRGQIGMKRIRPADRHDVTRCSCAGKCFFGVRLLGCMGLLLFVCTDRL